jgi:hypothetical protein
MTALDRLKTASLDMTWDPVARVCVSRVTPGANLGREDGETLVGAVDRWSSGSPARFAVLADGGGGHQTDRAYRATLSRYFRRRIDVATIAFFGLGTVLQVVVEMLRIATGMHLRVFSTEAEARAWLREEGFAA